MMKHINISHILRGIVGAFVFSAFTASPAAAQETQRIAAVVNDEVVSNFDVFERVKLVIATSGQKSTPEVLQRIAPQVLRALIDEHLRLQEGKRRNIDISEDEIDEAISTIEQNNRMPSGSFLAFLNERGISAETLKRRLHSELVWSKLVSRRVRRSLSISEEDIDNELDLIRENYGKPEFLLSEIFMSVADPSENRRVRDNAIELVRQLRDGADFDAMVNQFSEGVTANRGGGVGWVSVSQLSPKIIAAIKIMKIGTISDPIASGGGYLIVLLRDRRQLKGPDPNSSKIDLKQILLPLPADSSPQDIDATMALAAIIRETVSGCDDMVIIAAETDPNQPSDLGIMRIQDTPQDIRAVVSSLPVATVSQPFRTERGVHLLMICEKILSESNLPGRDQIRNSLYIKRLDQVSRQYLRDLRRDAFIDVRI